MDGVALNEDCRPFAQSPRRRLGDSRRCGPAYQTERAALPRCRRSSSPSRRSVNFLKRHLHCSGCVQSASGNLGASAVRNLRPASSFAASQQSPDETTDTPEYAAPSVLRPPAGPGVARLSVGTERPVSSEGSASVSKCARENCDGARQSGAPAPKRKPRHVGIPAFWPVPAGREEKVVVRGTPAKFVQVLDAANDAASVSPQIPPKIPPRWPCCPRISSDESAAPPTTKSPSRGRASCCVERVAYALRRRLRPRPARPKPSSASVPGSGTPLTRLIEYGRVIVCTPPVARFAVN